MVPFKEILLKQQAYWVSELQVDALVPSVFLQLVCDPVTDEKECDVTFKSVSEVSIHYYGEADDTQDEYLSTLIDISDKIENNKHYYFIATDTVEVSFCSEEMPLIVWVDPDKEYQHWETERIKVTKPLK